MLYMQSTSTSDGTYTLTVTFDIGTDLNFAQVLVQNRVSSALAVLAAAGAGAGRGGAAEVHLDPADRHADLAQRRATTACSSATTRPSIWSMSSSRIPGVGNVNVFGVGQYSMRIWLDPRKLKARGLVPPATSSRRSSSRASRLPPGRWARRRRRPARPSSTPSMLHGRARPIRQQFGNIVVKAESGAGGQLTRVKDVAPRRTRRADLRPVLPRQRPAGRRHRDLPVAGRQRAGGRHRACAPRWQQLAAQFPAGPGLAACRSTPRASSTPRSTRSIRPWSRRPCWCWS